MDLKTAYQQPADVIACMRIAAEGQEGMKAFLEKHAPAWQDK